MNSNGNERLPIKLILPKQAAERKVLGGGKPPQPFRTVDVEFRRQLCNQIDAVTQGLAVQLKETGVAPARVQLIPKAAAKSHRPDQLFSEETCPIVAAGGPCELFVKVSPDGLARLRNRIDKSNRPQDLKEISTVSSIEAITPNYRRGGQSPIEVLRRSARGARGFLTRVRLFDMGDAPDQDNMVAQFSRVCHELEITKDARGYSQSALTFGVEVFDPSQIEALSKLVSVRSISGMPLIRTVRTTAQGLKPLPNLRRREEFSGDVPAVVVVDTGVSDAIPELSSWIVGRETRVAPAYRNPSHGTFVAGLICFARELNPDLAGIDNNPCGVFDLQLVPNNDPEHGEIDSLTEQEFLVSLDAALRSHANEYKVWNLSIGSDEVCQIDAFSSFAEELDALQDKYQVTFVISAGNYNSRPLLDYPRHPDQITTGRITPPADSVLGLTVGSVSHIDFRPNGTGRNEPSCFSRHGAGPNHIIKPDLVHYGGACSGDGARVWGVRSICDEGSAEKCGTSFAAPLVSRTLAQIYHQITPTPRPVLARALLVHHARDPRSGLRVPDGDENVFGFGLPTSVPYCLECTPYTSTLVFEDVLRPGFFLEWDKFPYPSSLKRGDRYFGQISMTVAYAPARSGRWGSEYCESHIDAHFGVYRTSKTRGTGAERTKFVGLVPAEHRNRGGMHESFQIEVLRKWAPVRTYYRDLGTSGESGSRWRLMVRLLARHDVEKSERLESQPFALIVTISDPEQKAPVYDEMARNLRNRFQSQNISVRASAKVRST